MIDLPDSNDPVTPKDKYVFGLDLGFAQDFSALCLIKRSPKQTWRAARNVFETTYQHDCIYLHRWQLRTPYPAIVVETVKIVNSPNMRNLAGHKALAIDSTGVGMPVVDLFRKERLHASLMPIQIIGGSTTSREGDLRRVPKRDLVSSVQVLLQNRTLNIAPRLPLADTLTRELSNFQMKITDSANDVYGAWREGTYDDLVLAIALALWTANQSVYEPEEEYSESYRIYW